VRVFVGGLAVLGPGLDDWEAARHVLTGRSPFVLRSFVPPSPQSLPLAERRRVTATIRLAMAAAEAALGAAGIDDVTRLASVFVSSNGDGAVIGAILEALAGSSRVVSPTHFHNSVHNTPAAYWAIGTRSAGASTSFGCWDDSFAAGLLQAASKTAARREPVLLCAYDAPLPPPLKAVRETTLPFATAMMLTPGPAPFSICELEVRFVAREIGPETSEPHLAELLPLYHGNPAARSLRLLEILAQREADTVRLRYLDSHVAVGVRPC
jgi:hypothetical protein